jgi:hypothetical protein
MQRKMDRTGALGRRAIDRLAIALATISWSVITAASEDAPASLADALAATKPLLDVRLRSEWVAQAGIAHEAEAVTVRSRIGFETGKIAATGLLAEAVLMVPLTSRYNSTTNNNPSFPVVADPENYALNRLQLTNTTLPDTTLVVGRQRINLDDQRFVGAVDWRQNEQTLDGVRVTNRGIGKLTLDLSYLSQVNRVFGVNSPVGRYHGPDWLANASYPTRFGVLTGFAYALNFREAPQDSASTRGVRLKGEQRVAAVMLSYSASLATERSRGNNPLHYALGYRAIELTATHAPFSVGAGLEILDGDGVKGFSTPLATVHRFPGWADKFLTTPANGLRDRYVNLGYTLTHVAFVDSVAALVRFHLLDAERGASDYGRESDLQLQVKRSRVTGLLQYADYRADRFASGTRKWWIEFDFNM